MSQLLKLPSINRANKVLEIFRAGTDFFKNNDFCKGMSIFTIFSLNIV